MKFSLSNVPKVKTASAIVLMTAAFVLPYSVSAYPGKSEVAMAAKPGNQTIVEIVLANDGEFDVLQAAVVKAGLVDTLNGNNQYTVFAPTDAAFISTLGVADEAAAITAVENLDTAALTNILLYHVMHGRRISTSVLAKNKYRMLNGEFLMKTELMDAGITQVDISARNGVVHVINSVLMP